MADDDDVGDLSQATPGYKRALWLVIILNVGYGAIEMLGGFIAGSQGVKADALDFLGDGSITLMGLLAIGWSKVWRARAALLQGIFLALLGALVLGATIYRVFVIQAPEAGLMGLLGVIAFGINVASALILMKHRGGDASVQAVWLFSRNDALGNLAVIVAALLVWLSQTPWPDLVAATLIAGLFIHSAWEIIRASRGELSQLGSGR